MNALLTAEMLLWLGIAIVLLLLSSCGGQMASAAGDAGHSERDSTTTVEGGVCHLVLASEYDRSCATDSDCTAVGEVTSCPPDCTAVCSTYVKGISKSASAQYNAAFDRVTSGVPIPCFCPPGDILPCCRHGVCQTVECSAETDMLPACKDAGGLCELASEGCTGEVTAVGPPDACAYSDEICCVP